MASILILEDGSGVEDANSYVDAATARTYAANRGVTLLAAPETGTDQVEVWLVLAAQWLDAQAYLGVLASPSQGLQWPRVFSCPLLDYPYIPGLCVPWAWPIDPSYYSLPQKVKNAQCQLVIEQSNGVVLQPTTKGGADGQFVLREKVDVIETQYSEKIGTLSTPTLRIVDSLLRDFLIAGGGSLALKAVRV